MESTSRSPRGSGAAAGREDNSQLPRHRDACCILDSPLAHENIFGEVVCDRHEAADFCLSDFFHDGGGMEPSEENDVLGRGDADGGGRDGQSGQCCIAGRPLTKNFSGDVLCALHEEEASFLCPLDTFDDGTDLSAGADCPNGAVRLPQTTRTPPTPQAAAETLKLVNEEKEADRSRWARAGNDSVAAVRAANTIQKAWRNPAVRATVRARRARVFALEQAEVQRRVWASNKILAAWRMYQCGVAEAAVLEADEVRAAVEAVEAMEVAAAREAEITAGGGPSNGGELSCAYCSDRPLYENLLGQLVCRVHEELTFNAQYPSAKAAGGPGEEERGLSDSRCPVCDENISDGGSGGCRTGGKCPFGHAICAACTTQYVKNTLLPQGTVFWDRIKCVECAAYMGGMSVRRSIDDEDLVRVVEARQFDAAYLVCGERDPLSQEAVDKFTRPCPSCSTPTEKDGGCDHMTCFVCLHQYWYSCDCAYPRHKMGCDARR